MLTAINRHTHTQTHSRFILGLQHAHCDNLSCVFHNRPLVLHCLPIVCISHPAAMWWWHICIRIPHHVRKYFLCTPSTSVFICLICVSLIKNLSSPPPAPFQNTPLLCLLPPQPQLSQNALSSSPVAMETATGSASMAGGGGWVAVPSHHQGLLTGSFYGP